MALKIERERIFLKEMKIKNGIVASFFDEKEIKNLFKEFKLISLIEETKHDKITNKRTSMWNIICKKY